MSTIGNGDIAKVLPERDDLVFFASGVSNSLETRDSEFEREVNLLYEQSPSSHIVYFSSLIVFERDSPYTRHKRKMESLIKTIFKAYTIIRIGNIDWGTNPYTIINDMRRRFKAGEKVELRDEYRYVVGQDEFLYWINKIPDWSCEMNIPGERMKIKELVDRYVKE